MTAIADSRESKAHPRKFIPGPDRPDHGKRIRASKGNRPMNDEETPANKNAKATADSGANVDKIRDILFGSQMRDYDKKFARSEERLMKETQELREDIKRRFASLETYIKNEVEALSSRQKAEKSERIEALKELAKELQENTKAWERKAGQIDDQAAKSQRDLRQQILEESKRLAAEIGEKHSEVSRRLDQEGADLRATLTDRLALADLFTEVGLRLKNEFKLPEKQ